MTETIESVRLPLIGDPAPAFEVESTHGVISLDDYKGKWIMLFSHPNRPFALGSARERAADGTAPRVNPAIP